ncbi:MAG: NUDIX hydrolase [Asgard group archaeon]|nr:NUDIX hydrolase [Asgard group archaeon]
MNKSNSKHEIKLIEERVIFRNQYIGLRNDLVQFPNGKISEYAVTESSNFSGTLCLTKEKKLVMVKLYRYPWSKSSWEICSGFIDSGETSKQAAIREVKEETGYDVIKITHLIDYYPIGNNNSIGSLFFAEVKYSDASFDTDEIEKVKEFSIEEFEELVEKSKIIHGTTLLAFYYARSKGLIQ